MCLPKLYSGASTASRRPNSLDRLNRVHSRVANTDSVTEQNATKVIRALAARGYPQCQRQKAQKNGVPRPRSKIASTDFERHVAAGRQDQCKRELRRRNW